MIITNGLNKNEMENYLFCTAVLNIDKNIEFDMAMKKFQSLATKTIEEKGCLEFLVIPKRSTHQLTLWEIWENEEAFHLHHKAPYTVTLAEEKITTIEFFDSSFPIEF